MRWFTSSVVQNFSGFKTPLSHIPIEVALAIPIYVILAISVIRYWRIVWTTNCNFNKGIEKKRNIIAFILGLITFILLGILDSYIDKSQIISLLPILIICTAGVEDAFYLV